MDIEHNLVDEEAALAALPVGMFVLSKVGVIKMVNDEALQLTGWRRDEVVGRPILDLVHVDDKQFAVDVLAAGPRYRTVIAGPVHLRYMTGNGSVLSTQLWARNCLDEDGIDGYVITFGPEAADESLSRAVLASITEATPDTALNHVVAAFWAAPHNASAAYITRGANGFEVIGRWPFEPDVVERPGPWHQALAGTPTDIDDVDEMPEWLRELALEASIHTIWSRPVITAAGEVAAAIIVWRAMAGSPSPNQALSLDHASMIAALALDQAAHRRALERAAFTDPLTGLGNRSRLARVAGRTDRRERSPHRSIDWSEAEPSSSPAGVLYVDLDGFKVVNDSLGHAVGDQLLAEVANRVVDTVRATDEAIRVGGDEFVVLCHDPVTVEGLQSLAERLIAVVSHPYELADDHHIELGASVGIDADRSLDLHERITRADAAMYAAKADGRGGWRLAPERA